MTSHDAEHHGRGTSLEEGDALTDTVGWREERGVAWLTLNRPEQLNAMNREMIDRVREILVSLAHRDDIAVLVITGTGRAFSAGGDLREVSSPGTDLDQQQRELLDKSRTASLIRGLPQVTIAAINGACAGSAMGWAAACTLRIAAGDAFLSTAYASIGLSGDFGLSWSLSRLIGPGAAADWMLRPRRITVSEAYDAGFVQQVVAAETLRDEVSGIAIDIARLNPTARRGILENLADSSDSHIPWDEYLPREARRHVVAKVARTTEQHPV
jgi:2-(1,2-epoxy-1,2-dihydrophenyl)acetyl-CoA isomerase